jgi:hypothetical protein
MKNFRSPDNIEALSNLIHEFGSVLERFVSQEKDEASKGKKLDEVQSVANDFLVRTALNVGALPPLLSLYKSQSGMIQPIGLILRSVFSDFLTMCYLLTFANKENNKSFVNELHIFQRDSLRSFLEVGEMELNVRDYLKTIPSDGPTEADLKASHERTKTKVFPHLFTKAGKFKAAVELRETSDRALFHSKHEFVKPELSFVTEKYKWDRISKDEAFKKYILVYFGFKLFSQFQHYSKLSMDLIQKDSSEPYLTYYLIVAIDSVFIFTDFQMQIIAGGENEFSKSLNAIKEKLNSVIK